MTFSNSSLSPERVACCIAGCGPAGAVLGLLLARAGVEVTILEKHADFLRDFRGDTIHPSTLEILDELGLATRFLQLPHSEVRGFAFELGPQGSIGLDFASLGGKFPFVAFVPQWDFLEFITREARRYPTFHILLEAEVEDLLLDPDGTVEGVRYRSPHGDGQVHADLTIGADGRTSVTRAAAGLSLEESAPPMDVLWFRISRRPSDPETLQFKAAAGHFVALINRREYWQIAWVIPKGGFDRIRAAGLEAFRRSLVDLVPSLGDRIGEIGDWDMVKLLTVRADRLRRWYRPGYLAIGDAAHAMSPIGGVGINIAIQDAVQAANVLWRPLRSGTVTTRDLARVQFRREIPVRMTQAMQSAIQDRALRPMLDRGVGLQLPWIVRTLLQIESVRKVPARFIAYGVLRPHVRTPALVQPATAAVT